ncbi:MAG: alpha/beta hydrolase [Clostridiales bacterium]|nr:alpha/beta hydrolase [Clostridiales bacterium]
MKKRLLMLYGVNCTKEVWAYMEPYFGDYDIDYVEYPHEVTLQATKIDDITQWVYQNHHRHPYDAVIGHSMGGIIALQLISQYNMKFGEVIYLDTNLKPAEKFYRNIMTQKNMLKYGDEIKRMFSEERQFYQDCFFDSLQGDFDYTKYLWSIPQKIHAIYGDRGFREYQNRIQDLNLSHDILEKLDIRFVEDACHMIMMENPKQLSKIISEILK